MKAYVGPYFEFEIGVENLVNTPYPSSDIAKKLMAVVRLRPKVFESGKQTVRQHVVAFIPKKWVVGVSSVSEDNVFSINAGSVVDSQNMFYEEFIDECNELENYLDAETNVRFGFVSLE